MADGQTDGNDEANSRFSQFCDLDREQATSICSRVSPCSVFGVVELYRRGVAVRFLPGAIFFCLPKCPDRRFSVYRNRLPGNKMVLRVKLTTHPPINAEVRNVWRCTSAGVYTYVRRVHREDLTIICVLESIFQLLLLSIQLRNATPY